MPQRERIQFTPEEEPINFVPEGTVTEPPSSPASPVRRFTAGLFEALNPLPMFQIAAQAAANPMQFAVQSGLAAASKAPRMVEALEKGQRGKAALTAAEAVPFIGAPIEKLNQGDVAGAMGNVAAFALPELLSRFGNVTLPVPGAPSAERTAATAFGAKRGVPIDLATATGDPFYQGALKVVSRFPGVSGPYAALKEAQGRKLAQIGEGLGAEMAGVPPGTSLRETPSVLHETANRAYDRLREIAEQQKAPIRVGVDPQGQPILEEVAGPVALNPVKAALQPILTKVEKQMPEALKQASPGYQILKQVMDRPEVVDIDTAINDLSAIERVARGGQREHPALASRSQGLAKAVVPKLRAAVDKAAADLGPEATESLEAGRAATRAKYGAAELARIMGSRTKEGVMERAVGALRKWEDMEPSKKDRSFTPQQQQAITSFFRLAKYVEENPNPSGTGPAVALWSAGKLLVTNPVAGAGVLLGAKAVGNILTSPNGPQLLTKGLRIPIGSKIAPALWADIIARAGIRPEEQQLQLPEAPAP